MRKQNIARRLRARELQQKLALAAAAPAVPAKTKLSAN
jgi:hypothetical protein